MSADESMLSQETVGDAWSEHGSADPRTSVILQAARDGEVVVIDSLGIGDVVVGATIVAGLRRRHHGEFLTFAVKREMMPWATLFVDADSVAPIEQVHWGDRVYWPGQSHGDRERPEFGRLRRHDYYAECAGIEPTLPTVYLTPEERGWARGMAGEARPLIVISPYAGHGPREWPVNLYRDLVDRLRERGMHVLIIDGPGDGARSSIFGTSHCWGHAPGCVAALLEECSVLVGNDSGMAHVAGCLGSRIVPICASTSGTSVFGFYPRAYPVQAELSCSPCYWASSRGYRAACDLACHALQRLPVERVVAAVEEALRVE
jgi:hypothetical protein